MSPPKFDATHTRPAHTLARWHRDRQRALLARHPEVRAWMGPGAWTALAVFGLVALQLGLAWAVRDGPLWGVAVVAYGVGAVAVHALGVLIHECAHNLVFRGTAANSALSLVANIPLVMPAAIDFRHKHLAHHKNLGAGPALDFQMPDPGAARWVGASGWRKLVWQSFGSLVSPGRDVPGLGESSAAPWRRLNLAAQVVAVPLILWATGLGGAAYLLLSAFFAFGPHSLGMRGYGEHLDGAPGQPTNSYYGPWNWVSFNVGYHVEHHDFPAMAWYRVSRLRRVAPEFYADLFQVRSWTGLLASYLLTPELRLDRYASPAVGGAVTRERSPA